MILRALRRRSLDAHEATANVAIGLGINWAILVGVYGQPGTATAISATMIGVSWARSYAIRRAFRSLEGRST